MFCLVNVDLLDYTVSKKAADSLEFLMQEPQYNRSDGIQANVFPLLDSNLYTKHPSCSTSLV